MYCPKCSQQQVADEQRFCSRCGFPLAGVGLLLANDGLIPSTTPPQRDAGRRRQIIKESTLLTLSSWFVVFLAMTMWNKGGVVETFAKVGSVIFFVLGLISLLRFVYAFLFLKGDAGQTSEAAFPAAPRRAALPSPQDVPLSDYPRPNTREMVPRVSVTENTTRLLDED